MKMQETKIEIMTFDAQDVIATSGGHEGKDHAALRCFVYNSSTANYEFTYYTFKDNKWKESGYPAIILYTKGLLESDNSNIVDKLYEDDKGTGYDPLTNPTAKGVWFYKDETGEDIKWILCNENHPIQ